MANDTHITEQEAWELLSAPSGERPRIYGVPSIGDAANQIVALRSQANMTAYGPFNDIWLSGTTLADLVSKA